MLNPYHKFTLIKNNVEVLQDYHSEVLKYLRDQANFYKLTLKVVPLPTRLLHKRVELYVIGKTRYIVKPLND